VRNLALVAVAVFWGSNALACAVCGTGGNVPLTLNPSDFQRTLLQVSHETNIKNILSDGSISPSYTIDGRTKLTPSYGHRLGPKSFFTITTPYLINYREGRARGGFSGGLIAHRYTLQGQTWANRERPQIQLTSSLSLPAGRTIDGSRDEDFLDVTNSGSRHFSAGLDVWSGMGAFRYGATAAYSLGIKKQAFVGISDGFDGSVVVGHRTGGGGQLIAGLSASSIDYRQAGMQSSLSSSWFSTLYVQSGSDTLRVTVIQKGALKADYNTTKSLTWSIDYAKKI
jgi:hypothetical protein